MREISSRFNIERSPRMRFCHIRFGARIASEKQRKSSNTLKWSQGRFCRSLFQASFLYFLCRQKAGPRRATIITASCRLHVKYGDLFVCSSAHSDTMHQTEQKPIAHCDFNGKRSRTSFCSFQETETRRQHLTGGDIRTEEWYRCSL